MFDGKTFEVDKDLARLTSQLDRTYHLMKDGTWRTLDEIHAIVGGSQQGISARLRDFRKAKFQERCPTKEVLRRRRDGGLYEYRVVV